MTMPITLSRTEKQNGCIFFIADLVLVPPLLSLAGSVFHLGAAELNLAYYCINFAFTLWIFRKFLMGNLVVALDRLFPVLWYSILGYLGYDILSDLLAALTYWISPEFVNANDMSITAMLQSYPILAFYIAMIGPITEETLYRGLLFRGLWDRSPWLAYSVSMVLFSAAHVIGYLGVLSPLHLILSFVQYLPAGYCLAFSYRRSGTIFCPILIHIAINSLALFSILR